MSNPFAILADYPAEGPAVPQREKIVRQKDRHESGTGRRDKTKREGRGPSNWGNPADDAKPATKREQRVAKDEADASAEPVEEQIEEKSAPQYVSAAQFFDDDEDEEFVGVPQKATKADKAIASKYLDIMSNKAKKQAVVKEEVEEDENIIETNFLSTEQAQEEARKRAESRPPRRDSRPPRRDNRKPRQERPTERKEEAPKAEGDAPARKFARQPRKEGEKPQERGQRPPRRDDNKRPRDQRTGNVQHQRNQGNNHSKFSLDNFPSL